MLPWKWLGKLTWPSATSVISISAGATAVSLAMIHRGYQISYITNGQVTDFSIKPSEHGTNVDAVPKQVTVDWNESVKAAAKYKPKNNGVKDI